MKTKTGVDMVAICGSISSVKVWTAKKMIEARTAAGMTQAQLANWLGVTRAHVSHLEAGIRPVGPQTARLLAVLGKLSAGQWKAAQPPKRRKAP